MGVKGHPEVVKQFARIAGKLARFLCDVCHSFTKERATSKPSKSIHIFSNIALLYLASIVIEYSIFGINAFIYNEKWLISLLHNLCFSLLFLAAVSLRHMHFL